MGTVDGWLVGCTDNEYMMNEEVDKRINWLTFVIVKNLRVHYSPTRRYLNTNTLPKHARRATRPLAASTLLPVAASQD